MRFTASGSFVNAVSLMLRYSRLGQAGEGMREQRRPDSGAILQEVQVDHSLSNTSGSRVTLFCPRSSIAAPVKHPIFSDTSFQLVPREDETFQRIGALAQHEVRHATQMYGFQAGTFISETHGVFAFNIITR